MDDKKEKLIRFNMALFAELEYSAKRSGRSVEAQIRHFVIYGLNSYPDSK